MTTERTVEVGVGGDRKVGGGGWTIFEIGQIGNIGDIRKIRGLAPLCQQCKDTLKISYPPIIKPNPPPHIPGFPPPISSENFPSPPLPPPLQPFSKNFILPFMESRRGRGVRTMESAFKNFRKPF